MERSQDIAVALLACQTGLITDSQLREALSSSIAEPHADAVTQTLVARGFLRPHDLAHLRKMAASTPTHAGAAPPPASSQVPSAPSVSPSAPTLVDSIPSAVGDGSTTSASSADAPTASTIARPADTGIEASAASAASEGAEAGAAVAHPICVATAPPSPGSSTVATPAPVAPAPATPGQDTVARDPRGREEWTTPGENDASEPPPSYHKPSPWEDSDVVEHARLLARRKRNVNAPPGGVASSEEGAGGTTPRGRVSAGERAADARSGDPAAGGDGGEDAAEDDPAQDGDESTGGTVPPAAAVVYGELSEEARKADAPLTGRFADYTIVRELGRGGMGVVYEAEQATLGRRVALKVLPPTFAQQSDLLERFHTEARAAAKLRHPNIVQVYETGRHRGYYFIAMELIAGKSLLEVIRTERITPRRAATLAHALAEALEYAHANGVIHRDVKPTNVIVGEGDHVFLMDFGLAREGGGEGLTVTGVIIGTPTYMPPEQAEGRRGGTDAQSDVYSLGATFYELLTGQPPFIGDSWQSILRRAQVEEPVPPRKMVAAVPKDLETIVLKAMEKTKARRYPTMAAMRGDLKRWLDGEPIKARPVSMVERLVRRARKNRAASAFGAVALLVLLVALGLWWRARERNWALAEKDLAEFQDMRKSGDPAKLRASWDRIAHAIALSGEGRKFLEAKADARYEDLKAAIAKEQYDASLLDLLKEADGPVGKYAEELPKLNELITGVGSLEINTDPEGASYKIYDFNEKGLWDIQQSGDKYLLASGTTPMPKRPWPMGEYLISFARDSYVQVNFPILVQRNEAESVQVRLLPPTELPSDMAYVPAGETVLRVSRSGTIEVASFLISRMEVTQADYSRVLLANETEAAQHTPKYRDGKSIWTRLTPPPGLEALPVCGITAEDAAWYAQKIGRRLPSRDEMIRAGLGAGGRRFPWGSRWEADRVACASSVSGGRAVAEQVFAGGHSPFGCAHIAGNLSEWVLANPESPRPMYGALGGDSKCRYELQFSLDPPSTLEDPSDLERIGFRTATAVR